MTNTELIACIQAEERGEVVEQCMEGGSIWCRKTSQTWDTDNFIYRIRPEPHKGWVRWSESGTIKSEEYAQEKERFMIENGWQLVVEEIK